MIDSHQHFWKYSSEKYSWIPDEMAVIRKDFTPEDLYPELKKNGFDGCVAIQADQSEEETVKLLEYANAHDFIKGVVGWIDLSSEKMGERLDLYSRDPKFKGVRHTEWDEKGEFLKAPSFQKGIAALKEHELTYDLLLFDYQLRPAIDLVKQFPDQAFVLDHMGKPQISEGLSADWKQEIQELAKHQNVFCKISGLVTETKDLQWERDNFSPFLDTVVNAFGTDRLMFGSDWPVCIPAASYQEVVEICKGYFSAFSKEEKQKIFGENAVRFYNLK